jgi:hypothetical protein
VSETGDRALLLEQGPARCDDSSEGGSAVIEFIVIGLLLMIPLLYLIIALSRIQAASFAADSAAREAGRAFVTADDEPSGRRRAAASVELSLLDQGFKVSDGSLSIDCQSQNCLTPGGHVRTQVVVRVLLPGVPHGIARALSTSVSVRATELSTVDEFRTSATNP